MALNSVWALLYTSVLIFLSLLSAKWTVPFIFLESVTVNVATILAGLLTVVGPKCKGTNMGIQKAEQRKGTSQDSSLNLRTGRDARRRESYRLDTFPLSHHGILHFIANQVTVVDCGSQSEGDKRFH